MIIRATFHDNDFERPLISFFSRGLYGALRWANKELGDKENPTTDELLLYKETSILIDKYLRMIQDEKEFSDKDKDQLKVLLEKAYNTYLTNLYSENAEYLIKSLDISLIDKVEDKWENGEVLYYFPMHDKYIVM